MLRVTVEVIPHGIKEAAETLCCLYVGNDGTQGHMVGHYDVYEQDPAGQPYPRETRPGWLGKLKWVARSGPKTGRVRLAYKALEHYDRVLRTR